MLTCFPISVGEHSRPCTCPPADLRRTRQLRDRCQKLPTCRHQLPCPCFRDNSQSYTLMLTAIAHTTCLLFKTRAAAISTARSVERSSCGLVITENDCIRPHSPTEGRQERGKSSTVPCGAHVVQLPVGCLAQKAIDTLRGWPRGSVPAILKNPGQAFRCFFVPRLLLLFWVCQGTCLIWE